jgi:hypothetical protein
VRLGNRKRATCGSGMTGRLNYVLLLACTSAPAGPRLSTANVPVDPAFSSNPFASPRDDHPSIASLGGHERQHYVVIPRKVHAGGGGNKETDTDAGIGVVISNVFDHPHYSGMYHMIISLDPSGPAAQTGMIGEF